MKLRLTIQCTETDDGSQPKSPRLTEKAVIVVEKTATSLDEEAVMRGVVFMLKTLVGDYGYLEWFVAPAGTKGWERTKVENLETFINVSDRLKVYNPGGGLEAVLDVTSAD